jgi:hypothetical protein
MGVEQHGGGHYIGISAFGEGMPERRVVYGKRRHWGALASPSHPAIKSIRAPSFSDSNLLAAVRSPVTRDAGHSPSQASIAARAGRLMIGGGPMPAVSLKEFKHAFEAKCSDQGSVSPSARLPALLVGHKARKCACHC